MRSSLIAAGGALLAAALLGTAGPAVADDHDRWAHWAKQYPHHCNLGLNDDLIYHHVTHKGDVYAGVRDSDACKKEKHGDYDYYDKHDMHRPFWWRGHWSDGGGFGY
ncbi:hypothetical protein ETD86_51930 [Nonomuraea turkmeniaca]|uniref:Uncharacterized protein n=1 Tax=Nonomuraea turkmeniaca TaxID=103838 RepID=A0A5S4EVA3_9ACTN|nr:hypothetical protein [Nonomuraea turkmeniaca]TMR07214.1 hypothetical protein ETD86_51930 [Nonomuraea turkmeniaca]